MKNLGVVNVVVVCLSAVSHVALAEGTPPFITGKDGARIAAAVLTKGKPATFAAMAAAADGKQVPVQVHWKVEPEGAFGLKEEADGRVTVTALRDWFDEKPLREPTAKLIACAPTTCAMMTVTAVPDVAATWKAVMKFNVISHSENRDLRFVQDGRSITFDPEPDKPADPSRIATLRLDGNALRMVSPGSVLTVFDGELVDRTFSRGRWASSWGFSGTWTARRAP